MRKGTEFYAGAMYTVADAVKAKELNGRKDNRRDGGHPLTHEHNLMRALADTDHRGLIESILDNESGYRVFTEVINAYLESDRFDMVVQLLRKYPKHKASFDQLDLTTKLASTGDDDLIIEYVNYLKEEDVRCRVGFSSSDGSFYVQLMLSGLWDAGRNDLANTIREEYISPNERPFICALTRLLNGEDVTSQEIIAVFQEYCPLEEDENNRRRFRSSRDKSYIIPFFFNELYKRSAPVDLVKTAFLEHKGRHKLGLMEHLDGLPFRTITRAKYRVIDELLKTERIDEAEEFADEMGCIKWDIDWAKSDYVVKNSSLTEHREMLEERLQENEKEIEAIIKLIGSEEGIPNSRKYEDRVKYYTLRSGQCAAKAIFELRHGSPEMAQRYIAEMIEYVECIGISSDDENCPNSHKNWLRERKKDRKRYLRERFAAQGFLNQLPKLHGWSDAMGATHEEREAGKRRNIEGKIMKRKREEEESRQYFAQHRKGGDFIIRQMLDIDVEVGIAALKHQFHRSQMKNWARGIIILEKAPDKFDELFKILSEGYFQKHQHTVRWSADGSHDGLVKFYLAGRRLGVIGETEINELFEKWIDCRFVLDHGERDMPEEAIITLVEGLIRDGAFAEAIKYYEKAKEIGIDRKTNLVCLGLFVRYGAASVEGRTSGAACVFRDNCALLEDASPQMQVEYWNSKLEQSLLSEDKDGYSEAHEKLLELLENPSNIRIWTRLMTVKSLRSHHQKKADLMRAYAMHDECKQIRWRIASTMIDNDIPGAETMPEVKSKETPFKVAILLFKKLIHKGILHAHTAQYLTEEDLPYLRRILSQHQNQFNTVMETLEKDLLESTVSQKRVDVSAWAGILVLLNTVGVITPGIYAEAKASNFDAKVLAELSNKIEKFKRGVFTNQPTDPNLTSELLAELVWMAYQPANMKFSEVEELCSKVDNCTHHLDEYDFPDNGDKLDLLSNRDMHLRRGAALSTADDFFDSKKLHGILANENGESRVRAVHEQYVARTLCELGRFKMKDVEIGDILAVFYGDKYINTAINNWVSADTDNKRYAALIQLQEILGVYMEDNLEKAIVEFLNMDTGKTSNILNRFVKNVKKPGMKRAIETQLGVVIDDDSMSDIEILAKVVAQMFLKKFKPLQEARKSISDDIKNFVTDDDEEVSVSETPLRAVISKNKASFFAKASAGICTERNISLFEREDHFHINLVDENSQCCVGNAQAYIMRHNGGKYLLLRAINPSTKLLKRVDAQSLCDAIVDIGIQFADDNNFDGVMLSEQHGTWHALSNRPEVTRYIQGAYSDDVVKIGGFDITDGTQIHSAFLVKQLTKMHNLETYKSDLDPDDVFGTGESLAA